MRRAAIAATAVLAAVVGYGALDVYDRVPGVLTHGPVAQPPRPEPSGSPGRSTPSEAAYPTVLQVPPLEPLDRAAPTPTRAGLQRAISAFAADPALGSSSVVVVDALTGKTLFDRAGGVARVPASATKLLSAAAIDATLDGSTTLTTKVVDGPGKGQITLVAGGDMLLAPGRGSPSAVAGRAGLADLADIVAERLTAEKRRTVRLGVDLSFAAGPPTAPTWDGPYVATGVSAAVTMLGLAPQASTKRPGPADPPAAVTTRFAELLRERGISVSGPAVATVATDAAAGTSAGQRTQVLGAVESAPMRDLLALALATSDNGLTEGLARIASVRAGGRADFAGVGTFVRRQVGRLGVDVSDVRLVDASGLSRQNRVSAAVLADVLQLGITGGANDLDETVADLPVAGLSGTLKDRFDAKNASAGLGVVRAKTGTLTGVQALAGTVLTADGRLLTLVVLAEGSAPGAGTDSARAVLDRLAAALAGCGCR